jgi:hypothetical protein
VRRLRAKAALLAALCAVGLASCTAGSPRPAGPTGSTPSAPATASSRSTISAGGPRGAASLLATASGVVWAAHLQSGSQTLLRSVDGGQHWRTLQLARAHAGLGVVADFFLGGQHAWAVHERDDGATTVYRTSDGGRTWRATVVPGASRRRNVMFDQIGFADAAHGWLLAVSTSYGVPDALQLAAWRTDDGGASWTQLPARALPLQGLTLAAYAQSPCPTFAPPHLTMAADGTSWLTSGGCEHGAAHPMVWRSTDDGASWSSVALPAPAGGWGNWNVLGQGGASVGSVSIVGSGKSATLVLPVAVGPSSLVVERSADGGRRWRVAGRAADTRGAPVRTPPSELFDPISAAQWVVSAAGGLLETVDGGRSWAYRSARVDDPEQPIWFSSPRLGYRDGADLVAAQRTTDGGRRWTSLPVPAAGAARARWSSDDNYPISTLAASGPRTLLAGGGEGLQRSTDGGRSWTTALGATSPIRQIDVVDAGTAFAVTGDQLLRSLDAGRTWTPIQQPTAGPVEAVQFASASTGLALVLDRAVRTSGIQVVRTADAGRTWQPVRLPAGWSLDGATVAGPRPGAVCLTPSSGWLAAVQGARQAVFASADRGLSWRRVLGPSALPSTTAAIVQIAGCQAATGWALVNDLPPPSDPHGSSFIGYDLLRGGNLGRSWTDVLRSAGNPIRVRRPTALGHPALGPAGSPVGFTTSKSAAWLTTLTQGFGQQDGQVSFAASLDGGLSWIVTRLLASPALGSNWLATASAGAARAWVLLGGAKQSGRALAYATADGGREWQRVSTFTWAR